MYLQLYTLYSLNSVLLLFLFLSEIEFSCHHLSLCYLYSYEIKINPIDEQYRNYGKTCSRC